MVHVYKSNIFVNIQRYCDTDRVHRTALKKRGPLQSSTNKRRVDGRLDLEALLVLERSRRFKPLKRRVENLFEFFQRNVGMVL